MNRFPFSFHDALIGAALQGDRPEHDLMIKAAEYIRVLESAVCLLEDHHSYCTDDDYSSSSQERYVTEEWMRQQDDPGIAQQAIELLGLN